MIPMSQRGRGTGNGLGMQARNGGVPGGPEAGMPPMPGIQTKPMQIAPQATGGNMQALPSSPMGQSTGGNMQPTAQPQSPPTQTTAGNSQALASAFTGSMNTFQPFADAAYGAATRRLDPQFQQADSTFRQQMVNQGLSEGTEAYDKAYSNFSRDKNDAYANARNESLAQALAAQGQAFGQDFGQQRADMSDLMGLLNYGNNVTQANNQTLNSDQQRSMALLGFIPGMNAQPLDVMGSANMYNQQNMFNRQQQQNQNNSYWQAAGQLGSAFLGGG